MEVLLEKGIEIRGYYYVTFSPVLLSWIVVDLEENQHIEFPTGVEAAVFVIFCIYNGVLCEDFHDVANEFFCRIDTKTKIFAIS